MHECPLKLAYLLGFKSCMWIYPYFHWLICLYLICDIYVKLVDWLFMRTKFYFTWKKSEQNFLYKWWITWNKINTAVLLNNLPKALLNSIFHWLSGHEFEQTLRDSEGQGNLVCCSSWDHSVRQDWATEQQQGSSGSSKYMMTVWRVPVSACVPTWLFRTVVGVFFFFTF